MTTPLIREWMRTLIEGKIDPVEVTWFDISSVDLMTPGNAGLLTECRPPFEKCVVLHRGPSKTHASYDVMMVVIGDDPSKPICVTCWKGPTGNMPRRVPMMMYTIIDGEIKYGPAGDDPVNEDEARMILGFVASWYRSLVSGCEAYRPEIAPTFTNRRKIAQGKKPSYDWHTVIIEPQKPKSESLGGTHASPRLHDRRGHLRQYKSGKTGWVKACKVGNAALGTVFHDYEVRAA